ncbi:hypothetical protein [Paracoccus kondratievae]|uniref:hypothetical protein n=1 Tax=Paracoccus kondratievae TaxID=135740 RepID=UPI0035A22709
MATFSNETTFLLGRLNWDAIPKEPIVLGTFVVVAMGGVALLAALTRYRLWGWLWREWFTSVDLKRSASCISSLRWSCSCAALPMRS